MSSVVKSFLELLQPLEAEDRAVQRVQVLSRTEVGLKQLQSEARDRGYEEGLREGREAGRLEMLREMEEDRVHAIAEFAVKLQQLELEIGQAISGWFEAAEPKLAELAVLISARILDAELKLSPAQVVAITQAALGEVASATHATLRINVIDEPEIASRLVELVASQGLLKSIEVSSSVNAPRGVLVETEGGLVDGTVEHQLMAVLQAMRGQA